MKKKSAKRRASKYRVEYFTGKGPQPFYARLIRVRGGQTIATAGLPVRGDTAVEQNETFFVNLSNPTGGAVIADGPGLGTIQNDD